MTVSVGGDIAMLLFQSGITYSTAPGCLGAEHSDHPFSCDIDKEEDGLFLMHSCLEHLSMSNCIKPVDECHNYMNANVITYFVK